MGWTAGTPGRWSQERDDELRRLNALGTSATQIGLQLGCSRNAIIGRGTRLGIRWNWRAGRETIRITTKMQKAAARAEREAKQALMPPRPPRAPVPVDAPHTGEVVSIMALTNRSCRYPIGNVGDAGFGFCGAHRDDGQAYCGTHRRLCSSPVPVSTRKAARR